MVVPPGFLRGHAPVYPVSSCPATMAEPAQQEDEAELTEVIVTGSRIVRSGVAGATPVTSVEASEMEVMAPSTLMAAVSQMPQFVNNQAPETAYVNQDSVSQEVAMARRLFADQEWPVIDVTRRSIEETAAAIINLLGERRPEALV